MVWGMGESKTTLENTTKPIYLARFEPSVRRPKRLTRVENGESSEPRLCRGFLLSIFRV